ncbi:MAG: RNA methyltransferase, partial [Planctomycetota bacterium]|nr:RNA methyltransferase [Planctomycetota bacterium]
CVPDRIGPTPSCGYCGTGRNSRAFSTVIVPIDDLEDPRLEPYRDVRDRDLRGRDDLFLVESKRVVARFAEHPEQVHSLLLSEAAVDNMADVLRDLPDHIPVYVTSLAGMIQIAGFRIHRGVLAAGYRPHHRELEAQTRLADLATPGRKRVVVPVGVTDVDNIGSIFRNVAGFEADAVLLDAACADPLYRKASRVSVGHVFSIPWGVASNFFETLNWLRLLQFRIIALETGPRSVDLRRVDPGERDVLLVGAEATGIPDDVLAVCDEVVNIPMASAVPSLNVSVATAVALHEWNRDLL